MADVTIPGIANPNTTVFTGGAQPKFRYVYFENAMLKGEVAQWSDTSGKIGYGVEDAVDSSTRVAGVVPVAITAAGWGWLQTGGYCDYITTDTNVTAPNADTLQTDVYLLALNNTNAPCAIGKTAAELIAMMTTGADTAGPTSVLGMNMVVDAAAVGACILCPAYQ